MKTITLTQVQRDPKLLSQAQVPLKLVDKRRNIVISIIFPVANSNKEKFHKEVFGTRKSNDDALAIQKEMRNER